MSILETLLGGGDKSSTTTQSLSPEMATLLNLQAIIARRQIDNIQELNPFQRRLLQYSMNELERQQKESTAFNNAVKPSDLARLVDMQLGRAERLGPIQEEMLQMQLDAMRRGGAATPEQIRLINQSTNAAIKAGESDINQNTREGIGMISDEIANARGLRLTDTPILREATLLTDRANEQKSQLVNTLRANQANARLNFPLQAQQVMSGINFQQQGLNDAASQFAAQLRDRAFQNRLAFQGNMTGLGLGLAGIGANGGGGGGGTSTTTQSGGGLNLGGIGGLLSGIGSIGTLFPR